MTDPEHPPRLTAEERREAEYRYRHFTLAKAALTATEAFPGWRVADAEIIGDFDGSPERISAWLIFGTRHEAERARASHDALRARAREVLDRAGYPADAVKTVELLFTSEPEIEEGGGRFLFFR
jgi:hypothetical protein